MELYGMQFFSFLLFSILTLKIIYQKLISLSLSSILLHGCKMSSLFVHSPVVKILVSVLRVFGKGLVPSP